MLRLLLACLALALGSLPAAAAGCFPVASAEPRVQLASLPAGATVQLTFLGHSSFLIETAGGVTAVTDYNDSVGSPVVPTIVTMNNAHSTHYTDSIPEGVQQTLRGWNPAGGEARIDVTVGDLRVRNVPTAVHGRYGAETNTNSTFVFEVEDLCIAHVGHLHQILERSQLGELGQIDVLLVPVDGVYTMSQAEMVEVIRQVGAPLVIPMHYFGSRTLASFLDLVRDSHEVVMAEEPVVALSRMSLPSRPRILVLPGR